MCPDEEMEPVEAARRVLELLQELLDGQEALRCHCESNFARILEELEWGDADAEHRQQEEHQEEALQRAGGRLSQLASGGLGGFAANSVLSRFSVNIEHLGDLHRPPQGRPGPRATAAPRRRPRTLAELQPPEVASLSTEDCLPRRVTQGTRLKSLASKISSEDLLTDADMPQAPAKHRRSIKDASCSWRSVDALPGIQASMNGGLGLSEHWPKELQRRELDKQADLPDSDFVSQFAVSVAEDKSGRYDAAGPSFATFEAFNGRGLILDPHSKFRILFDICSFIVLMYDLLGLPVILAWDIPVKGVLAELAWATTAFWVVDLCLNFVTGYYSHGYLVTNLRTIVKRYLRGWFIMDVAVLFSNLLAAAFAGSGTTGGGTDTASLLRIAKATRVLRIFSFLRMLRISEVCKKLMDEYVGSELMPLLEIPGLLMVISYINHVVGCCWYFIGTTAQSDTGTHWTDTRLLQSTTRYRDSSMVYQYVTAVHWSLTQMTPGSMNIQAENSAERVFNIACLLLGMMFFGSVVSRLSAKLVEYRNTQQEKNTALSNLSHLLRSANVPTTVAVRARVQAAERLSNRPAMSKEMVLQLLPGKLQVEIHYEIVKTWINHPLMRWWEAVDLLALQLTCRAAMKIHTLTNQDALFHTGTTAEAVYVVMRGGLVYMQDPLTSKVELPCECSVGPKEWLCEPAMWVHWLHVGTAEAVRQTELLEVHVEDLASMVKLSRSTQLVFNHYGIIYHRRLTASKPPLSSFPTDLGVPHASFEEIYPGLPRQIQELVAAAAMHHFQHRMKLPAAALQSVKAEVQDRKCVVMLDANGQPHRFLAIAAVVVNSRENRKLASLAQWIPGRGFTKIECQWPATKIASGAAIHKAVDSILRTWLSPIAHALELSDSFADTSRFTAVGRFGITTQYLRLLHAAELRADAASLPIASARVSWPSAGSTGSLPAALQDCFVLAKLLPQDVAGGLPGARSDRLTPAPQLIPSDSQGAAVKFLGYEFALCAWLTDEEFHHLGSDSGREQLRAFLATRELESGVLQSAVENVQDLGALVVACDHQM